MNQQENINCHLQIPECLIKNFSYSCQDKNIDSNGKEFPSNVKKISELNVNDMSVKEELPNNVGVEKNRYSQVGEGFFSANFESSAKDAFDIIKKRIKNMQIKKEDGIFININEISTIKIFLENMLYRSNYAFERVKQFEYYKQDKFLLEKIIMFNSNDKNFFDAFQNYGLLINKTKLDLVTNSMSFYTAPLSSVYESTSNDLVLCVPITPKILLVMSKSDINNNKILYGNNYNNVENLNFFCLNNELIFNKGFIYGNKNSICKVREFYFSFLQEKLSRDAL